MTQAISVIVREFGGIRPFARALGRPASTVQYWPDKGFLPRGERAAVLEALVQHGLPKSKAAQLVDKAVLGATHSGGAA